jgi:hypothetical protein
MDVNFPKMGSKFFSYYYQNIFYILETSKSLTSEYKYLLLRGKFLLLSSFTIELLVSNNILNLISHRSRIVYVHTQILNLALTEMYVWGKYLSPNLTFHVWEICSCFFIET